MIYDDVPCENLDANHDGRNSPRPSSCWGCALISQTGKLRPWEQNPHPVLLQGSKKEKNSRKAAGMMGLQVHREKQDFV